MNLRVLIVRLDGVGDTVLLAPLIRSLRDAGHEVGVVVADRARGLYRDAMVTQHVWTSEREAVVLAELRTFRYDEVLIASEKPEAYRLARQANIPRRIGFWNGFAKPLKSMWLLGMLTSFRYRAVTDTDEHEVEALFRLGRHHLPEVIIPKSPKRLAALFVEPASMRQKPGSLAITLNRKWQDIADMPTFIRLVRSALDSAQAAGMMRSDVVRCFAAPDEEAFAAPIADALGVPLRIFESTRTWVDAVARCERMLTPDTGAAHLASMLDVTTIVCYSPKAPASQGKRWRPWAGSPIIVAADAWQRDAEHALTQALLHGATARFGAR